MGEFRSRIISRRLRYVLAHNDLSCEVFVYAQGVSTHLAHKHLSC